MNGLKFVSSVICPDVNLELVYIAFLYTATRTADWLSHIWHREIHSDQKRSLMILCLDWPVAYFNLVTLSILEN